MKNIALADLHPHPRNPRFEPRRDVVDQIASSITATGAFDEAHALIVRPNAAGFEIISGHHRSLAAQQAGLESVPCWVREMSDEEAYMMLVSANAQSELSALERGMHALHSDLDVKAYAANVGRARGSVQNEVYAAEVTDAVRDIAHERLAEKVHHLREIHAAPFWLWPAMVAKLVVDGLTVEATRRIVERFKKLVPPPDWCDCRAIADDLISGALTIQQMKEFQSRVDTALQSLRSNGEDAERLGQELNAELTSANPSKISTVIKIINAKLGEQAALIREREQADLLRSQRDEEIAARLARLRTSVSLDEWKTLASDEQLVLLTEAPHETGTFNKQEGDAIEWAQWSWNPVTGCLHDCPYCYARDIAESSRVAKVYPNGFAPTIRPASLFVPRNMRVPKEAAKDTRFKNVFTCSMADLFGRWVPRAWIEAVLRSIAASPEWNFLCLTKFPKRMAEFDIPSNAWMGTTVDLQARVPNAEAAFANVRSGVRWLSIEPMLEPLKFKRLDLFQWIVIGGASPSSQTPEWKPPFNWIADLVAQADAAGVRVYFKTNLLGNRRLELPFDAPIKGDPLKAPDVFNYLGRKAAA